MSKNNKRKLKDLFIEDLGTVVGGGKWPPVTTLAIGEEDGGPFPTTLAVGEEGGGTTLYLAEEATTLAIGEEDGGI